MDIEQLATKFKTLSNRDMSEQSLERVGKVVSIHASNYAPVDTGLLSSSFLYETEENAVLIGANDNVDYATVNEFEHKTKSGFLRGGLDNNISTIVDFISEDLMEALK